MNCDDDSSSPSVWTQRLQALWEIILVSGVVSSLLTSLIFSVVFAVIYRGAKRFKLMEMDFGFLAAYLFFESAVTFLILWMLMKARRETLSSLGLSLKQWKTNIFWGIVAAPCLLVVSGITGLVFKYFLPEYFLEKNPLMEMIHSPLHLVLFVLVAIIAGGVKEELQRAFILNRFRQTLGGAWVGLVLWSLAFGAGHTAQGAQGVCAATVLGFVFGVLYLMRGNLLLPIAAHAAYNTLLILIYWFAIGINK